MKHKHGLTTWERFKIKLRRILCTHDWRYHDMERTYYPQLYGSISRLRICSKCLKVQYWGDEYNSFHHGDLDQWWDLEVGKDESKGR
jgi:hypothetical protein